jgi:hypothetical protein
MTSVSMPTSAALIVNGSFEQPQLKRGSWKPLSSIPGWKLSEGPAIEVQNRVAGNPYEGNQFVELDSYGSSGIFQEVPTQAGQVYQLEFAFGGRPGTQAADNKVKVQWGNSVVAELSGKPGVWKKYSYIVKGIGSTTRLSFLDVGISNSLGSYLDAVSLTPKKLAKPEAGEVCLYQDINYGGWQRCFSTDQANFVQLGIDNTVSSLKVSPGVRAELYEYVNYSGFKQVYTKDTLKVGNADNKFSALKVIKAPPAHVDDRPVTNLALKKAVKQSSQGYGGEPKRAVDGNTSGIYGHNSVTHTLAQYQSWWAVDLGGMYDIETINVYNRTDCCGERLSNFYVMVSKTPFPAELNNAKNSASWNQHVAGRARQKESFTVGVKGRYVRVQLAGSNYLSLAEVEVMGRVPVAADTLNEGLVAHYKFEDNTKDSSGNNNHGTGRGQLTYALGKIGQAGNFEGANDVVMAILPQVKKTYSVSLFAKFKNNAQGENLLFYLTRQRHRDRLGYLSTYPIGKRTWHFGSQRYGKGWEDRKATIKEPSGLLDNSWYHLVFVLNDKQISLYVNGNKLKTINSTHHSDIENHRNLKLLIGGSTEGYQWMYGLIDEVRFYNRVLSETEIKRLGSCQ